MAYPIALNNQYRSEKAIGLTTAKSFPEWNATRLATLNEEVLQQVSRVSIEEIQTTLNVAIMKVETAQEEVKAVVKVAKATLALAIYEEAASAADNAGTAISRKGVIASFMSDGGLSKNGANTYYQNIRRKKGLIV